MNNLANSQKDVLQQFLDLLIEMKIDYCVIGGLGVNAYVEPVVSMDLDVIVSDKGMGKLRKAKKNVQNREIPP